MSELEIVRGLYRAVFKDLSVLHPAISFELERDFSHLLETDQSVGLWLYTVLLPDACKFFDKSLSSGRLLDERPFLLGKKSRSDVRPSFLYGLYAEVFDSDGVLKANPSPLCVASIRQVYLMMKKLNKDCEDKYVNEAVNVFRKIETDLPRSWDKTWDCDNPTWTERYGHPLWGVVDSAGGTDLFPKWSCPLQGSGIDPRWDEFRRLCLRFTSQLGWFDSFSLKPKHGPGAVSDKSDYVKYDMVHWSERLEAVFPYDWHAATDFSVPDYVLVREFPSRLLAVPKTQKGPRLIAAEPTAHQWIQGGIRRWLEERIKSTFLVDSIDFRDQGVSKQLALKGSLTGDIATVDLSSASDRLSTRLVEYVFQGPGREPLLDALHACRSRVCQISDSEFILLRKFATQGSACTFPVQTIVYTLISMWAIALTRGLSVDECLTIGKEVQVFGDDIIIPTDSYGALCGLLSTLGLVVNMSKSHSEGNFREACGMDAFMGVEVTPVYVRQLYGPSPSSLESVIAVSNNLHLAGWWHTADFFLRTVPEEERKLLPVISTEDGTLGLISFVGPDHAHLASRWNDQLHYIEYKVLSVDTKVQRKVTHGNGSLVQFFHEEPDPLLPYRGGQVTTVTSRKRRHWASLTG